MLSIRVAVVAGLALCGVAQANTVNLAYVGKGAGRDVRVQVGSDTFNVFAGQLRHNASSGTGSLSWLAGQVTTFCADLTQQVTSSGATYSATAIQNLPVSSGWPSMGPQRAQAVFELYTAAADRQFGTNADWAAAFQIALWEIVYDYNPSSPSSFNLGAGNVRVTNTSGGALGTGIMSKVTELVGLLGSGLTSVGLVGLSNPHKQDQIVQVIPLPPAGWAGLAMLGGIAAWRRIRK